MTEKSISLGFIFILSSTTTMFAQNNLKNDIMSVKTVTIDYSGKSDPPIPVIV
jgi:hypothetical protein